MDMSPAAVKPSVTGSGGCAAPGEPAMQPVAIGQKDRVLNTACRMLLRAGGPVAITDLAAELGEDLAAITSLVADYERLGRMRRDGEQIAASIGLSAIPSEFEIVTGTRRMWAWCAKTALGVVAALGLGGFVTGRSPLSGAPVTVEFTGSIPHRSTLAVFWPDDSFRDTCGSASEEYCPALAIFESAEAAKSWARQQGIAGEALTVEDAADRASEHFGDVLDVTGEGRDLTDRLGRAAGLREVRTG